MRLKQDKHLELADWNECRQMERNASEWVYFTLISPLAFVFLFFAVKSPLSKHKQPIRCLLFIRLIRALHTLKSRSSCKFSSGNRAAAKLVVVFVWCSNLQKISNLVRKTETNTTCTCFCMKWHLFCVHFIYICPKVMLGWITWAPIVQIFVEKRSEICIHEQFRTKLVRLV